ncbi:MAG TPA: hypothetical protein VMT20_14980, partial [Terriglobia bacterium]|nr:hypothetical protein [Terriglobia bacterium]
ASRGPQTSQILVVENSLRFICGLDSLWACHPCLSILVVNVQNSETAGVNHGFLLNAGNFTKLDFPGATFTQALGLNNQQQVVGFYMDAAGLTHGFVYNNGTFQPVDDPSGIGTTTINGTNDLGQIVGFYVDSSGNTDGFLGTPQ